jgi:hypothetical protein
VLFIVLKSGIFVKLGTERNSPLEGWTALLDGVENKIFIHNIKILHPVSPLCKHIRDTPLKRGIKGKCKVAPYGKTLWRGKTSATKKRKSPALWGLGCR